MGQGSFVARMELSRVCATRNPRHASRRRGHRNAIVACAAQFEAAHVDGVDPRTAQRIDVLIGGAGFAGLALAIALRQGLGSVVLGRGRRSGARPRRAMRGRPPSWRRPGGCSRPSGSGTDRIDAQPILDMVVTDSRLHDAVRPVFLTFDGRGRAGRTVRPHDRECSAARCAGGEGEERRRGAARRAPSTRSRVLRPERNRHAASHRCRARRWRRVRGPPAGGRRRRTLRHSRARRHRDHGWTYGQSASSRPWRTSAITAAAPRSIFCPPGRSRSCR